MPNVLPPRSAHRHRPPRSAPSSARPPCNRTCHRNGVRRFSEFRSVTHRRSFYTLCIASIFDTRLMRPYTCTYNVTEVMQLPRVTDATNGSMPCAAQTQAQLPPHRAIAVATQLWPFAVCINTPRRRQPTACDGEAWPCFRERRGQAARCKPTRTETKSGCSKAHGGAAQLSAGDEACAARSLASGAATTRKRPQTTIAESLKRVPRQ